MRFLPYILRHLRRKWFRTLATAIAVSLCIALFCFLQTVLAAVSSSLKSASETRLVVRHAVSVIFLLPMWYENKIAAVDGVKDVAHSSWFGGVYKDRKNFFPNFAVQAETYFNVFPEYIVTRDQKEKFLEDKRGAIIGRKLAERFGWAIGDTVQLTSSIPYYQRGTPFDFVIRGIYDVDDVKHPGTNTQAMFVHFDYIYEGTGRRISPGSFQVKIADATKAGEISRKIDALFENSSAETKTETESAFRAGFISLAGNLALLLNGIGLVVTFTILLVTANTMVMAVRERRREIAVLKTLGYSSGLVMALILTESLVLGALGGSLGIVNARLLMSALVRVPGMGDNFRPLVAAGLSPLLAAAGFALALAIGLIAGLIPAVLAFRARITETLRTV